MDRCITTGSEDFLLVFDGDDQHVVVDQLFACGVSDRPSSNGRVVLYRDLSDFGATGEANEIRKGTPSVALFGSIRGIGVIRIRPDEIFFLDLDTETGDSFRNSPKIRGVLSNPEDV